MSGKHRISRDRLTDVPVHEVDKQVEVVTPGVKGVHPLELPPARKGGAVNEQPGNGLDRVRHDETCQHDKRLVKEKHE